MEWDPNPIFWTVPGIDLSIAWYGVLFALGFLAGYFIMVRLAKGELGDRKSAVIFTDRLLLCCVIGTVIGARLGHVFFYGWPWFKAHPMEIFSIREGGLASHGGAVGVFVALLVARWTLRRRFPSVTLLRLLDMIVVPIALTGAFIRMGNFMNQEIIGIPTSVPWAVLFGHPADGGTVVPRHPAQLYECFSYIVIFGLLFTLSQVKGVSARRGLVSGLFFVGVFGVRFLVEFVKERTGQVLPPDAFLSMGQVLSIPFIAIGFALIGFSLSRKVSPA